MSAFLAGTAFGLLFVVLYDWAIDDWRKRAIMHLERLRDHTATYEAAKAHNFQAAEDWKARSLAALTAARDECAKFAAMQHHAQAMERLIDEGRSL